MYTGGTGEKLSGENYERSLDRESNPSLFTEWGKWGRALRTIFFSVFHKTQFQIKGGRCVRKRNIFDFLGKRGNFFKRIFKHVFNCEGNVDSI